MRSPAQSAARDRARASVVKWCAPCGARKKDCRYCHYCRADRCPACRLIGRYSGPARCACCGKRPATWYLVAGRKVCMWCRPAALLLHAQQCMLSWRTDAAGRRALCKKHVALRCDIYVVWDDECLFIAIRLVLYVRHGRWLGLLDKSSLSYRGKDDALEILTSYLRSLLPKLPKKAVLLVSLAS